MSTGDASERDLIDGKQNIVFNFCMGQKKSIILALVDYLEKGGQLGKFRAELFASVMSAMNNFSQNLPEIPKETRVINDLIREYLYWNGYQCTERTMVLGNEYFFKTQLIGPCEVGQ